MQYGGSIPTKDTVSCSDNFNSPYKVNTKAASLPRVQKGTTTYAEDLLCDGKFRKRSSGLGCKERSVFKVLGRRISSPFSSDAKE